MNISDLKKFFSLSDIIQGVVIYPVGDTIAALILKEFSIYRLLGIAAVGGTFYALEIPNYFRWIDKKISENRDILASCKRTGFAVLYFNPFWIARHLFFIKFFSGTWDAIGWNLMILATWSFLVNIPVSFIANYLIQNKLPYSWRFFGSSVFSAVMAVYYAFSEIFFSKF